jgi:hypothetical protein
MPGCQLSSSGDVAVYFADGTPVRIEQGPRWLIQLAYCPPPWLDSVLWIVVLAVLGLSTLGWYRNDGLDEATISQIAENGLIAIGVIVATTTLVRLDVLGYVGDVLVGGGVGWTGAQVIVRLVERATADDAGA